MDVFKWFRGRSEAARLEQGDVKALITDMATAPIARPVDANSTPACWK